MLRIPSSGVAEEDVSLGMIGVLGCGVTGGGRWVQIWACPSCRPQRMVYQMDWDGCDLQSGAIYLDVMIFRVPFLLKKRELT